MLSIEKNKNLKQYNTFGLDVYCTYFVEISTPEEFKELISTDVYRNSDKLILGGGSNILFTKNFNGIVIKNSIKEIRIIEEKNDYVLIKAGAGEVWHEFVVYCIQNNYCGLENLSLIPGCVGASPMQNIGAYGVEIKDVFYSLDAIHMQSGELTSFNAKECEFGYRESVFKNKHKGKYFITSVTFKLNKAPKLNTQYGAINDELKNMGITNPGIKDVSNAVISIRKSKLPNPAEMGNAGSFFKNPEVSAEKYQSLKKQFDNLVAYPLENGNYKLAAGWLIEQCGLKGYELKGAAVHTKQALVLVNKNNASGDSVFELSAYVLQKVNEKFGVQLEREVNIV